MRLLGLVFCGLGLMTASSGLAQQTRTIIDGTELSAKVVATGFDEPLLLTSPPGDPRLFVVERTGRIKIMLQDRVLPQAFLDISGLVSGQVERGLLGLAFHPDFARNGRFFIDYTDLAGTIQIAELQVAPTGNVVDPSTLTPVLSIAHRTNANHNGGWLAFGPEGALYVGVGDGGGANDKSGNGQNRNRLLGKILRIDVDHAKPYAIPPDNPFAKVGGAPEIFVFGLRNPWRATFDDGLIYIADVGQNAWEEINVAQITGPVQNFGWNEMEGANCFKSTQCNPAGLTLPVLTYSHNEGCSVIGGAVYRGNSMPAVTGRYFFSDFCSGALMSFRYRDGLAEDRVNSVGDLGSLGQVTSFGQDSQGEIYVLTLDGAVLRLMPAAP
ncbi:MAG: PQQ-dependent sugar dehydrogenase [bacterium]